MKTTEKKLWILRIVSLILTVVSIVDVGYLVYQGMTSEAEEKVVWQVGLVFAVIAVLLMVAILLKKDVIALIAYVCMSVTGAVMLIGILGEGAEAPWISVVAFPLAGILLAISVKKCPIPVAAGIFACAIGVMIGGEDVVHMLAMAPVIVAGLLLNILRSQELKCDNSAGKQ
ncbi:MAG: hypothetical protein IKX10_02625 [Lachnospiraceae bacterium]|nr:hypothetical protein [Lachnospiraceae bacterium]